MSVPYLYVCATSSSHNDDIIHNFIDKPQCQNHIEHIQRQRAQSDNGNLQNEFSDLLVQLLC